MSGVMFDKILGRIREGDDEGGGGGGGNTPKIITINAINALTTEQCESLNAGDVVVVAQNGVNYTCVVTSKTSSVIYLCYIYGDNKEITRARYAKVNGEWGFDNLKYLVLDVQHRRNCSDDYLAAANHHVGRRRSSGNRSQHAL